MHRASERAGKAAGKGREGGSDCVISVRQTPSDPRSLHLSSTLNRDFASEALALILTILGPIIVGRDGVLVHQTHTIVLGLDGGIPRT